MRANIKLFTLDLNVANICRHLERDSIGLSNKEMAFSKNRAIGKITIQYEA